MTADVIIALVALSGWCGFFALVAAVDRICGRGWFE